eukprot:g16117.t1
MVQLGPLSMPPEVGVDVKGAVAGRLGSHSRGCAVGCEDQERRPPELPSRRPSLQQRLRRRAAILLQQERHNLLRELHAELDLERKRFEARKPALSEEAYRAARREHDSAVEKQEHELRMVLARREFKDLKEAARERLALAHAQEKEKALARLRRSLGRGTGHSVSGLREELWEEAHEKRTRALREGEAAFEHSCRLLRQQSHDRTKAKIEVMGEEATIAEQSALAVLREVEANATSEELSRLSVELERERREAEVELKRQLHREAARSVSLAVEASTSKHKQAQQEVTAAAAEALRRALEEAGEEEMARTRAVLGREARMLDDRRCSLISMVEDGLSDCSLRKLAVAANSPPPLASPSSSSSSSSSLSPSPVRRPRPSSSFQSMPSQPSPMRILTPERNRNTGGRKAEVVVGRLGLGSSIHGPAIGNGRDRDGNPNAPSSARGAKRSVNTNTATYVVDGRDTARSSKEKGECAAAAVRAVKAVRNVEGAAAAAERMYAERARGIMRLRAAMALRERQDQSTSNGMGGANMSSAIERANGAGEGVGVGAGRSRAEGGGPRMVDGDDDDDDDGRGAERGEGGLVGCGGCAVLFEANERLLEEARARGFVNE